MAKFKVGDLVCCVTAFGDAVPGDIGVVKEEITGNPATPRNGGEYYVNFFVHAEVHNMWGDELEKVDDEI